MNPDDLKFLEKYRRRDSKYLEKSSENSHSFFGELFGQAIFYGVGLAFFWFISQKWSWMGFLALGILLLFGIPLYFIVRRR